MLVFENTPVPFSGGTAHASLSVEDGDDGLNVRYELRADTGAVYVMTASNVGDGQLGGLIEATMEDWAGEA
jgi:hypothetical protein